MPTDEPPTRALSALSFKIGRWAEARATGWGVAVLPVVLVVLLLAGVLLR
jgi:hypothetical protein